jgi:hypothetical protein
VPRGLPKLVTHSATYTRWVGTVISRGQVCGLRFRATFAKEPSSKTKRIQFIRRLDASVMETAPGRDKCLMVRKRQSTTIFVQSPNKSVRRTSREMDIPPSPVQKKKKNILRKCFRFKTYRCQMLQHETELHILLWLPLKNWRYFSLTKLSSVTNRLFIYPGMLKPT